MTGGIRPYAPRQFTASAAGTVRQRAIWSVLSVDQKCPSQQFHGECCRSVPVLNVLQHLPTAVTVYYPCNEIGAGNV